MKQSKLNEIIRLHELWLKGDRRGKRAVFRAIEIVGLSFYRANLRNALFLDVSIERCGLTEVDLRDAILDNVEFEDSNLRRAVFSGATLDVVFSGVNLRDARFRNCVFENVDFASGDLRGVDFTGVKINNVWASNDFVDDMKLTTETLNVLFPPICPVTGSFVGWKKIRRNLIVKLEIPDGAQRLSAIGSNKCRCSEAKVLAIETLEGKQSRIKRARSLHDWLFVYRIGSVVKPRLWQFDDDRRIECAPGIHFFMTREEAVEY